VNEAQFLMFSGWFLFANNGRDLKITPVVCKFLFANFWLAFGQFSFDDDRDMGFLCGEPID
jgi:hypothetical protein